MGQRKRKRAKEEKKGQRKIGRDKGREQRKRAKEERNGQRKRKRKR